MKTKQAGFTLVEIAIVLVIIGLLLGGILKGQEMITQAKIKNVVNDFNGITAAVNSYQDRYRAMPGDELNANTVGRWGAAAFGGDGNGVLCTGVCASPTTALYNAPSVVPAAAANEPNLFWMHLRLAGFVAGPTTGQSSTQQPSNATNGILGVQTTGMGFTSSIVCSSNIPDKIAIAVDTQMDDATSTTGQVRGLLQTAPNPPAGATTPTLAYAETGTNQYLLCKNM